MLSVHTQGALLKNFHPHVHGILAAGLLVRGRTFLHVPALPEEEASEIFRVKVLEMLEEKADLEPEWKETLLEWEHHGGFRVWSGSPIYPEQKSNLRRLAATSSGHPSTWRSSPTTLLSRR